MKYLTVIIMSMLLTMTGCNKKERISDYEPAPNTSAGKDGSEAGTGSSGSLGSENPSESQTP